jgi:hypothetical protein
MKLHDPIINSNKEHNAKCEKLTGSMKHSPSWEDDSSTAGLEPKVHYRFDKSPPKRQESSPQSHTLFKIHSNVILLATTRSLNALFPSGFQTNFL